MEKRIKGCNGMEDGKDLRPVGFKEKKNAKGKKKVKNTETR